MDTLKIASLLLLLVLTATACSSPRPTVERVQNPSKQATAQPLSPSPRDGWKTYANVASGLSFMYPGSLTLVESETSTNFETKLITADLETPEYAAAVRQGTTVETLPLLRIGAHVPKFPAPANECLGNTTQTATLSIAGESVRKCEGLTMGQAHHLEMSFSHGSSY